MSNIVKKILKIKGMHCTSCAMDIDFDLEDLDGVLEAKTSFAKQESEVEFDQDKLDIQTIVAAIGKTGYMAQIKSD
jgi:copper chaperone CopZ